MTAQKTAWVPEIMYEEEVNGKTSAIPFIPVPESESMPTMLYVFESRETGEFEPGPQGEELPIVERELHQYADMAVLKANLGPEIYDEVRICLGLKPLKVAEAEGRKITEKVRDNLGKT